MTIGINWLAVVLSTVLSMALAAAWYSKATFGPIWRQLTGITEEDSKKAGMKPMIITLFANFVTALVLAGAISISAKFFGNNSLWNAVLVGFVSWLAYSATTLSTHNAFELKPLKLTLINNGYQLFLFVGIAIVIGLFGA